MDAETTDYKENIQKFVVDNYMVPKHVEFRVELPKTSSGKITKTELS